jgi:hypothetical protein
MAVITKSSIADPSIDVSVGVVSWIEKRFCQIQNIQIPASQFRMFNSPSTYILQKNWIFGISHGLHTHQNPQL